MPARRATIRLPVGPVAALRACRLALSPRVWECEDRGTDGLVAHEWPWRLNCQTRPARIEIRIDSAAADRTELRLDASVHGLGPIPSRHLASHLQAVEERIRERTRLPAKLVRVTPRIHVEQENELVDRARAGDRDAFEELVRRHANRLHAVVLRFLHDQEAAQEVTQETFLRAWRGIDRFRGNSRFFTWLYRIGINEAKRRADRQPAQATISLDEDPNLEAPDWSQGPEFRAARTDLRRALEDSIRALPIEYRAPVILRDVEGLSTEEAAEVMELSDAAFKSRLHRARLMLRRALDEHFLEAGE
jgi:RNA polymerase sigma-70 factor, ECF subfamily